MTLLVPLERTESLLAWRFTRPEFADSALTGQGGVYAAGRWHRAGQQFIYVASSWSLAALEAFVHLGRRDSAIPFVYFSVKSR